MRQRPRKTGTPMCYLCNQPSSQFQPIITQKLQLPNYIMPSYTDYLTYEI